MNFLFLLALLNLQPGHVMASTLTIDRADKYERLFIDTETFPHEFYASFATVYKINNKIVKTDEFWNQPLMGRVVQVKVVPKNGFWFALRLNLLDDK